MRFLLVHDCFISIDYWAHMHTHAWNRHAHIQLARRDPIFREHQSDLACWETPSCLGREYTFIYSHAFLLLASSLFMHHLSTHLSATLFSHSLCEFQLHTVFPGSVIRITICASHSAFTTSSRSDLFSSSTLLLSLDSVSIAGFVFRKWNRFCIPATQSYLSFLSLKQPFISFPSHLSLSV